MVNSQFSVIIALLGVGLGWGEYQLPQPQHNLNLTLAGLTLHPPTTTNNTKTLPLPSHITTHPLLPLKPQPTISTKSLRQL